MSDESGACGRSSTRIVKLWRAVLLLSLLLVAPGAFAAEAQPAAADPELEKRVMQVAEELRCLVCQNQTIADSNAPLAVDLRDQVREKMKQGMSNEEIVDYMVARYGDFVRYRPPVKATTLILWFGPVLLMIAAVVLLVRRVRSRASTASDDTLSEADHERAHALLTGEEERQ